MTNQTNPNSGPTLAFRLYHYRNGDGKDVFKLKRKWLGLWWWEKKTEYSYDSCWSYVLAFSSRAHAMDHVKLAGDEFRAELAAEKRAKLTLVVIEEVEG